MTGAMRVALAIMLLAAGPGTAQNAPPAPLVAWAEAHDLAALAAARCGDLALDAERAEIELGAALAEAFATADGYAAWANGPGAAARQLAVREAAAARIAARARDAGVDLRRDAELCAWARQQLRDNRPAGRLLRPAVR